MKWKPYEVRLFKADGVGFVRFNPSYEMEALRRLLADTEGVVAGGVSILLMKWKPYED